MKAPQTAILHYSAPPVIGGVEAVIQAQVDLLIRAGHAVTVIAGEGDEQALPSEAEFVLIPEISSQHPRVLELSEKLEIGEVPGSFETFSDNITESLQDILEKFDNLIVHNVFTKHFNLPLTVALYNLLEGKTIQNCIAWCHDFTWTSSHSGHKVHPGSPWDSLRTYRQDVIYVVVSKRRQKTLADLLEIPADQIKVIYNGVDPKMILGLTEEGYALIQRLDLFKNDPILLMPVRVTQAKNIELALKVVASLKTNGVKPKLILTGPPDPHDAKNMEYFQSLLDLRQELNIEREMHFVFESGSDPEKPYFIGMDVVGDLFRVSDLLFMPSHREGFGMPVLEAGLAGLPVLSTSVPAAQEIGGKNVVIFSTEDSPDEIAALIMECTAQRPVHRHRVKVRQNYTWQAIFDHDIRPLLKG
jgi:glycosyltransferase involved in cell wall biosynthesis